MEFEDLMGCSLNLTSGNREAKDNKDGSGGCLDKDWWNNWTDSRGQLRS